MIAEHLILVQRHSASTMLNAAAEKPKDQLDCCHTYVDS